MESWGDVSELDPEVILELRGKIGQYALMTFPLLGLVCAEKK